MFYFKPLLSSFIFSFILFVSATALCFVNVSAHAEELCFDSNQKKITPLMQPIPLNILEDTQLSGEREGKIKWGAVRGLVQKSFQSVLKKLLDPKIIKGPKQRGVALTELNRPGFISFQNLEMTIYPFPFVSFSWKEIWQYVLLEGTLLSPQAVLISYQKIEGTSQLQRFCGSILLKIFNVKATDLFFYEEVKSARRSREDIILGHRGTLEELRKIEEESP